MFLKFTPPLSELPQRRHKILKAIHFMVSGVADHETRLDRCALFVGPSTEM
jgi:hypothetical protein